MTTKHSMPFIQTRAAAEAFQAVDAIVESGGVGLLVGDPGSGKTAVLRAYTRLSNADASACFVLLYRAEVVNTPRSLVQALLLQLGVVWSGGTRVGFVVLRQRIREAGCRVVLIDDAQRLARNTVDMLRALHEGTGLALVLCSAGRFPHQLGRKQAELAHHVTAVHDLGALALDDVLALVRSSRSRKRRTYWEAIAMARALLRLSGGNIRRVLQSWQAANALARARHRRVSPVLVVNATSGLRHVA